MALKTYQEDSSPLSSSPLMPRGPALNQIFMMSRTRRCVIQGVKTTIPFHQRVMGSDLFRSGSVHTQLIEQGAFS